MIRARTPALLLALLAALALAGAPAAPAQDLGPLGPIEEPAPVQTEPEEADDGLGFGGPAGPLVVGAALVLLAGIAAYILRDARRRAPVEERSRPGQEPEDAPARARERERRRRQTRAKGRAARTARRRNR